MLCTFALVSRHNVVVFARARRRATSRRLSLSLSSDSGQHHAACASRITPPSPQVYSAFHHKPNERNAELTTLSRAVEALQLAHRHTDHHACTRHSLQEKFAPSVIFESGVRISVDHPLGLGNRQFSRQERGIRLWTAQPIFRLFLRCFSDERRPNVWCGPGISEQATAYVRVH